MEMKAAFLHVGRAGEPWSETTNAGGIGKQSNFLHVERCSIFILQAFGVSKPSRGEQGWLGGSTRGCLNLNTPPGFHCKWVMGCILLSCTMV